MNYIAFGELANPVHACLAFATSSAEAKEALAVAQATLRIAVGKPLAADGRRYANAVAELSASWRIGCVYKTCGFHK